MTFAWSEAEIACLKKLAEIYAKGETTWQVSAGWESIGLTAENYRPVINLLQDRAYIDWPWNERPPVFTYITIRGAVVDVVREFAEHEKQKQEAKDLVESFKTTMRKHPIWGPIIIIGIVFTIVVTAVNQLASLLKTLGAF